MISNSLCSAPEGIALTLSEEQTVDAFNDRILVPAGLFGRATRIKRQCEKDAGYASRPAPSLDGGNSLGVSIIALLSFWYLFGWQDALLLVVVVALHEADHAAAMRMVGIGVQGIYLVPFFGGAAVSKTAYQTQGHLGFVALMGAVSASPREMNEISLFVRTAMGGVVVVGCSHPGIEKILDAVIKAEPRIYSVLGGFRLVDAPDAEVNGMVMRLRDRWGIERMAADHCTGQFAFVEMVRIYGASFDHAGVGAVIALPA